MTYNQARCGTCCSIAKIMMGIAKAETSNCNPSREAAEHINNE